MPKFGNILGETTADRVPTAKLQALLDEHNSGEGILSTTEEAVFEFEIARRKTVKDMVCIVMRFSEVKAKGEVHEKNDILGVTSTARRAWEIIEEDAYRMRTRCRHEKNKTRLCKGKDRWVFHESTYTGAKEKTSWYILLYPVRK